MAQDIVGAVIALLKADAAVAALVGTRVYGGELPASQAKAGAQPSRQLRSIVVQLAGGAGFVGTIQLQAALLDVASYGESFKGASLVNQASHQALKEAQRVVLNNTLIHSLDVASGPLSFRDRDTQWPVVTETWSYLASECPTP